MTIKAVYFNDDDQSRYDKLGLNTELKDKVHQLFIDFCEKVEKDSKKEVLKDGESARTEINPENKPGSM